MDAETEAQYVAFVDAALPSLRKLARSATWDTHHADDLVQTTLEKLYVAWPRLTRRDEMPLAYARTTLVRSLVSESRRPWRRRETVTEHLPERAGQDPFGAVDVSVDVMEGLRRLSPRQRLVLYLRHVEDLSVAQTAEAMGCSQGTVKSTTSDAVQALRAALAEGVTTDA